MLRAENIHNSYDGKQETLKGVDLTVNEGEVIVIVGPSGSGKTTLLRCISFLEKSTAGKLIIDDDVIDMPHANKKEISKARMDMGFVFQSYNLFRNMTVMQNVLESLVTARKVDKLEATNRAKEVLTKVGMMEHAYKYPDELSGGQQQRVAIARAMAPNPDLIMFDEPTSALDPELTVEVLDAMRDLAKSGSTMLVVTHEMEFAKEIATRIVFMEDGLIVEEGSPEVMFNNPVKERTREFLGRKNK